MKHSIKNASCAKNLTLRRRYGRKRTHYFRVRAIETDGTVHIFDLPVKTFYGAVDIANALSERRGYDIHVFKTQGTFL